jgi:SAM-dependent methyltransferase
MRETNPKTFEFWESKFAMEGSMWGDEPSDSALLALSMFQKEGLQKILVPGAGYGRNAALFQKNGLSVTGIELSSAAVALAGKKDIRFPIHCGSVLNMPFDQTVFDGIFCYALLHLFNKAERGLFLSRCMDQLEINGLMFFTVVSKDSYLYAQGPETDRDTFEIYPGIPVFFYDRSSLEEEFSFLRIDRIEEIDEPIKFMKDQPALKCLYVVGRK